MFLYQVAHNVSFLFFVMLAVIDAQCLCLLVYLVLQNGDSLILFHLLVGVIYEEKLPYIYNLNFQWSSLQYYF